MQDRRSWQRGGRGSIRREEERRGALETGEVLSFVITAGVMLSSSLLFPSFYWLFILFALVDGLSTRFRNNLVLSLDRICYALIVILLGAAALGLNVIAMISTTVAVIALLDFLFLLRQIRSGSRSDFFAIILQRFRSYLYTLVPAGVFAAGLTYIGAAAIGASVGPANAILELGLASIAVFLIILFVARPPENFE